MNIRSVFRLGVLVLLPIGQANALVLDNWNDIDLDASGDSIEVNYGSDWFSLEWMAGGSNILDPLGIDTIFYNFDNADYDGYVTNVYLGALGTNEITTDWHTNFGGTTAGGGFGNFVSMKSLDGGGTDGVDNVLFFLLDGDVNFLANANGSMFAAHVRYDEGCSGWVSDGTTSSEDSGSCGGNNVPEPDMLGLLAIGLLGTFVARCRMKV